MENYSIWKHDDPAPEIKQPPFVPGDVPKRRQKRGARLFEFDGKLMRLSDIAVVTGIPTHTLQRRLLSGRTPEEAFQNVDYRWGEYKTKQKNMAARFLYHGEMLTFKEISARTGVSLNTIYGRYYSGWAIDDLGKPARKKGDGNGTD